MRYAILLLASLLAVSADPIPAGSQRIAGGMPAPIAQFPFSAAVTFGPAMVYHCGGSIISNRVILTAAHCFVATPPAPFTQWNVRVGSTNANLGGTTHAILTIILHPDFNATTYNSDIAVMHTTTNILITANVQPAPIAGANYNIAANQPVFAIGWGTAFYGGPLNTAVLQQVQIWTVSQATCRNRYAELGLGISINDNMLCAGWLDGVGRGQCYRDSGSPLVHNGVIFGVFSFSVGCGHSRQPGVNTRVPNYAPWILANQPTPLSP